jgi:hypothetical protein
MDGGRRDIAHSPAPALSRLEPLPREAVDTADGGVRDLVEGGGGEVDRALDEAPGTAVDNCDVDGLALVCSRSRLDTGARGSGVDLQVARIFLPQIGLRFGLSPAPGKASNARNEMAAM